REVIEVASRLNKEEGMTVILITHFMEEALLADKAVIINKGELVASGTPAEIFERGEQLESFNLALPEISVIRNEIRAAGLEIGDCLYPEKFAEEIAKLAEVKFFKMRSLGHIPAPIDEEEAEIPQDNAQNGENTVNNDKNDNWDVDIRDLTYTYSAKSPFATKALKGVNLHISEGEFFGIIGHTGSGKSTLVQHLNALIKLPKAGKRYKKPRVKKGQTPPAEPSITIGKYDLANKKCDWGALRADVGMVFQYPEYQLFADTVFADVAFGLKNFKKGLSKEEIETAVKDSLEAVGLNYEEVKDKSPFDLSGGQKRRAAIAGVIVTKPKILVLDEPAAGLDPIGKRDIMKLLHSLHGDWCKTVIIVSHDMDEIAENCTRACVVSDGTIYACDTPSNLFKDKDGLYSLGLDVPLTAKICDELSKRGIEVDCDFTAKGFARAVIEGFNGGVANA
ncbi:MAG: ATP-binding cassette domain-containing protein, partial [Clostridia bacterium]|nr:ATP-binding cassette domain-containing protein [Clostridia bacterium]